MEKEILFRKAMEASKNTYSPYSNFPVGAALLTRKGEYYLGANIENASYGLANCAERSAMFSAYSNGVRKDDIIALAIYSPKNHLVYPCGACRQVMTELLNRDTKIFVVCGDMTNYKELTLDDVMPYSFTDEDMEND